MHTVANADRCACRVFLIAVIRQELRGTPHMVGFLAALNGQHRGRGAVAKNPAISVLRVAVRVQHDLFIKAERIIDQIPSNVSAWPYFFYKFRKRNGHLCVDTFWNLPDLCAGGKYTIGGFHILHQVKLCAALRVVPAADSNNDNAVRNLWGTAQCNGCIRQRTDAAEVQLALLQTSGLFDDKFGTCALRQGAVGSNRVGFAAQNGYIIYIHQIQQLFDFGKACIRTAVQRSKLNFFRCSATVCSVQPISLACAQIMRVRYS